MANRNNPSRLNCAALLLLWTITIVTAGQNNAMGKPVKESPTIKGLMVSIFKDLSSILPISLDEEKYANPENSKFIQEHFKNLVQSADTFSRVSLANRDNFHFLVRNLDKDIRQSYGLYQAGSYKQSAFVLQNLTENCFACHARYPESKNTPGKEEFYQQLNFAKLSPAEQAKLLVVTRQFERARDTYSKMMTEPGNPLFLTAMENYLILSFSIFHDTQGPAVLLQQVAKQPSNPIMMQTQVSGWQKDLAFLEKSKALKEPSMESYQQLVKLAKERTDYFYDRRGLVFWVALKSVLDQLTLEEYPSEVESELYYWLGVSATKLENSTWITQTEDYLEKSIQLTEKKDKAVLAYTLLENNTILGYTGSSGTHLPPDVSERLQRLRQEVASKQL